LDALELTFSVDCPPKRAFELWAERTTVWWPKGHSVSADPRLMVTFEPHAGGRIYERTPAGDEHEWGEVLDWEPPHRLRYLWHLRFDRSDATEVEVTFTAAAGGGTDVAIVHRGWERLGAAAEKRRERNRRGWSGVIEPYCRAASAV
jgi:uncharacterized protein YndB with AHSA1/START domain